MHFRSLPALIASGDNKGKPSFVEIKAAKMVGADQKPVQYSIAAERWQYPQYGPAPRFVTEGEGDKAREVEVPWTEDEANQAIEEAKKDAGGAVKLAAFINGSARDKSLAGGKNLIRTKEAGAYDDVINAGLRFTKEWTLAESEKLTNKEVVERAEDLATKVDDMSPDDLKAAIKALFGKK